MMDRREKLVRYCAIYTTHPSYAPQFGPRIGSQGLGYALALADLSDAAIEKLRDRITSSLWLSRCINRENREIAAGMRPPHVPCHLRQL